MFHYSVRDMFKNYLSEHMEHYDPTTEPKVVNKRKWHL